MDAHARPALLLINTPLVAGDARGGLYPPLGSLTLGSFLSARGVGVGILDPSVDLRLPPEHAALPARVLAATAQAARARAPGVIGISTMGAVEGSFAVALSLLLREQLPDTPVVLGGSWATGYAALILDHHPTIDAVALGAGEHSLLDALHAGLGKGQRAAVAARLASVPGWMVRGGDGRPRATGATRRPLAEESAPVDLTLLDHREQYDTLVYLTSRGCPHHCAFCTEPFMFHEQLHEPLGKIERDLAAFEHERSAGYLWLCDSLFGASRPRLDAVLPLLARSRYEFLCEARVDSLEPQLLQAIRAAGGNLVYFGLEAVSDRSLLHIDKVASRPAAARYRERALAVVEACAAADVVPVIGVLNPVPGDGPDDLEQTLRFLAQLTLAGEAGAARAGTQVRPFFHAFPYRIDLGTAAARDYPRDRQRYGTACNVEEDEIFVEREVTRASEAVDEAAARAFREAVRAANRAGPLVMGRVLRSMPRPFVATDWMTQVASARRG